MNKNLKILYAVLIVLLFIPLIQSNFHLFKIKNLDGAYVPAIKPQINYEQWFSNNFQDSLNTYLNENFGFRNFFVRINNQIDYSLFKKTNAAKIVIGKNGYLFEDNYLEAFNGSDFIGEQAIDSLIELALKAQNILKDNNIEMLFVFAPGKANFFPEYVPYPYNTHKKNPTNFEVIIKKSINAGINHIDLNTWFKQMKDTISYPLYPKCGIHWSYYGMFLSADTIIKKIESLRNIKMPKMQLESIEIDKTQRGTDYDIGDIMNLLFPIKTYAMPYPIIKYSETNNIKPKVLVVGDSYYWNIYFSDIPKNMFETVDFYYYNSSIYNDGTNVVRGSTQNINLYNEIKKRDIIIFLQTDGGLNNFGFGFFKDIINAFNSDYYLAKIEYYKQAILNDPNWKKEIERKAIEKNISFEEMLFLDAKYMVDQE